MGNMWLHQPGIFVTVYLAEFGIICPVFAYSLHILFPGMIPRPSVSVVHHVWNLIPFLVLELFLLAFDTVHVSLQPWNEIYNQLN